MYCVAVRRDFIAQHYLIGGDWGPENKLHSHHYVIELRLEGKDLDKHGYLVDIVDIENHLEETTAYFSDRTLNELDEFQGLNPSIEHFSRIICERLNGRIDASNIIQITTVIWENDIAWASYQLRRE